MKNLLAFLLVLASFALLALKTQAQATNAAPDAANSPIRVAFVGDSITAGAGSKNPYPAQLQVLLGNGWQVQNFGVSGRTLLKKGDYPYWKENAYTAAKNFAPNMVIIMLGTNDTKPQNWKFFNEFAADYKDLIESFKNLPSKPKIFICLPCPVFGAGGYGITSGNLEQETPVLNQIAQDEGAKIIDMHAPLADKPQLEPDRVHPNADGDAIMAKTAADALTAK